MATNNATGAGLIERSISIPGSWEHRAYWGANSIGYGSDGAVSRKNMGALPAGGGWVKLTVPARALTSAVFLSTLTQAKSAAWKFITIAKVVVFAAVAMVGKPVMLSLDTAGLDLTNARITWEARDCQLDFGSTVVVTPKSAGAHWAEAEIVWPDGRRVFATGSFTVQ